MRPIALGFTAYTRFRMHFWQLTGLSGSYLKKIGDREVTLYPLPSNALYEFLKTYPARSLENYTLNFNADKGQERSG